MDNETYKQLVLSYIPYGVQVQYEGILNGKEKSAYRKEYNALTDNKSGFLSGGFPNYNPPADVVGLKLGLIKKVSFWKNYTNLEVGTKTHGLKRFTLNLNTEPKFKLVLHTLFHYYTMITLSGLSSDIQHIEEIESLYTNTKNINQVSYATIQTLCKNHIDYDGLIPKGLAVDINTLTK